MASTNAENFLEAYRRLENLMRERQREDKYTSFSALVDKSGDSVVQRYNRELKRYADLRNAIVHHEHEDDQPIADPRTDAVENFQEAVEKITDPPGLGPFRRNVYTAAPSDDIGVVMEKMEHENFSQMPIQDEEEVIAVLTTNTITRWIGAELHQDGEGLLVTETSVGDVLHHTEREDNYSFLSRDATLYEAHEAFQVGKSLREPPDAVLITHNGRSSESLLGIITPFDLPDLVSRL